MFWVSVLFRVSSLVGIALLAIVLERGIFCEQFRCNIIIDRKTFEAVIDVHKVKGVLIYGVSSLCYVLMLKKLWVKLSKKFCAHKGVF